eukprot:COSAG01_NODE_8716_length_2687_cov_5.427357_1_plen_139_part_10
MGLVPGNNWVDATSRHVDHLPGASREPIGSGCAPQGMSASSPRGPARRAPCAYCRNKWGDPAGPDYGGLVPRRAVGGYGAKRPPPLETLIRCKRTGPADLMNDRSDASCRPIRRSSSLDGAPAHTSHRMRKVHREWTRP